jgi:lysophospholipase L1-like esterase
MGDDSFNDVTKKLVEEAIANIGRDLWKDFIDYDNNVVPPIYQLPKQGHYKITADYNVSTTPMAQSFCDHEWVNVGLLFDKYVCKKCDKDKLY